MSKRQWLKIDVDAVLRERLPRYYRFIPKFLISCSNARYAKTR